MPTNCTLFFDRKSERLFPLKKKVSYQVFALFWISYKNGILII